ncbi:uncharacterized protein LOC141854109 [Brevipalpus obovatus]|uniref:uncharacterized protein LOC141854109 n=1 Tax=Brevipalpus obovatus TaxID=246614 RepID=UPI003D9F25C2
MGWSRSNKQILPKPPSTSNSSSASSATASTHQINANGTIVSGNGTASGHNKSASSITVTQSTNHVINNGVNTSGSGTTTINLSASSHAPSSIGTNQGASGVGATTVGQTTITSPLQAGTATAPQMLLNTAPGKQQMSFISSPPGTILLNQMIPGLSSQPILIQGNLSGVGGPLQLTLRQQPSPQVVTVSSASGNGGTGNNSVNVVASVSSTQTSATPIISALTASHPNQNSVQRNTSSNHVAPTYVFQNQGATVTGSSTGPTMVMGPGQPNFVRGQNIILTRPQNIIGQAPQIIQNPGQQLFQIQTPNGPLYVTLQTQPTLGPASGLPILQTHMTPNQTTVPLTSTMMLLQPQGGQSGTNHPTLQTILQTSQHQSGDSLSHQQSAGHTIAGNNIIFSQPGAMIASQPMINQEKSNNRTTTPNNSRSAKPRSVTKSVNLAELLKETGILPDSSPPQSPSSLGNSTSRQTPLFSDNSDLTTSLSQAESNQPVTLTSTPNSSSSSTLLNVQTSVVNTTQQPTVVMVPSFSNHQESNILLTSATGPTSGAPPQLRLSLGPDGSIFLQPNIQPAPINNNSSKPNSNNQTSSSNINTTNSITTSVVNSSTNNNQGATIQDPAASLTSISSSKFMDSLKDTNGPGLSQPSPDSTTPTLDASTPTSTATSLSTPPTSSTSSNTSTSSTTSSTTNSFASASPSITPIAVSPSLTPIASSPTILTSNNNNNSKLTTQQTLMQHLNAGSTMKVGDSMTSMTITPIMGPPIREDLKSQSPFIPLMMQQGSDSGSKDNSNRVTVKQEHRSEQETRTEIVSVSFPQLLHPSSSSISTSSASLISINNCDNLVQNSSMPVLLANTPLILQEDGKLSTTTTPNQNSFLSHSLTTNPRSQILTPTSSSTSTTCTPSLTTQASAPTLVEQNGYQFVQISLNNQEFIERLETQIKKLSALRSPRDEQKQLLHELLNLQKKMSEAKTQPQNSNSGNGKVILTSISPSNQAELLLSPQQSTTTQVRLPPSLFTDNKTQPQVDQQQLIQQATSSPSCQLANLLNKNAANKQLRILTSAPSNNTLSSSNAVPVGTQFITITSPAKSQQLLSTQNLSSNSNSSTPLSAPSIIKQQNVSSINNGQAVIQVVTLSTPSASSSSTNHSIRTSSKSTETITVELDKPKASCSSFQQQVIADQAAAIRPDTKTPFRSRTDACKRLLRYHVFNTPVPTEEQLSKVDRDFEVVAASLLQRKNELFNRFRYNLLKSSMYETPKTDYIVLDKLFVNDETASLQSDREIIAQGKDLNLPPPPDSWKQMLQESLEEEERISMNRKRKSSAMEDDFLVECHEFNKKYDLPDDHESNETDDDEEESEDEDDDETEENSTEDISKYLGPNQDSCVPDLNFYSDFNHSISSLHQDVNQLQHQYPAQHDDNQDLLFNNDWKEGDFLNNRNSAPSNRIDVWGNRFESENDLAVTTILGNDEEEGDPGDNGLSVDLNSIQDIHLLNKYACSGPDQGYEQMPNQSAENEGEDDFDDAGNEEEDDEDDGSGQHHPNDSDLQLPCGLNSLIDSITMPQSNQAPNQAPSPYYNEMCPTSTSTSGYRQQTQPSPYNNQMHPMMHSPRSNNNLLPDFRSNSQMISDSILDEAVRSISSWS